MLATGKAPSFISILTIMTRILAIGEPTGEQKAVLVGFQAGDIKCQKLKFNLTPGEDETACSMN